MPKLFSMEITANHDIPGLEKDIDNDPERGPGDEADILVVMKYFSKSAASKRFEPLDRNRLERFALKFSQQKRLARLFDTVLSPHATLGKFSL